MSDAGNSVVVIVEGDVVEQQPVRKSGTLNQHAAALITNLTSIQEVGRGAAAGAEIVRADVVILDEVVVGSSLKNKADSRGCHAVTRNLVAADVLCAAYRVVVC